MFIAKIVHLQRFKWQLCSVLFAEKGNVRSRIRHFSSRLRPTRLVSWSC